MFFFISIYILLKYNLWLNPSSSAILRIILSFLFLLILIIAYIFYIFKDNNIILNFLNNYSIENILLIFFIIMSFYMGINANNFRKYLKNFENISLIIDKPIPIEQTELNINDKAYMNGDLISGYNWWWTNPALSIILRGK